MPSRRRGRTPRCAPFAASPARRAGRRPRRAPRRRRPAAAATAGSTAPRPPATRCAAAATAGRPGRSSRSRWATNAQLATQKNAATASSRSVATAFGGEQLAQRPPRRAPSAAARAAAGGRGGSRTPSGRSARCGRVSSSSSEVIRKPLSTKNTSTPRKPPDSPGMPPWSASTSATAIARTPSSAGIPRLGLTYRRGPTRIGAALDGSTECDGSAVRSRRDPSLLLEQGILWARRHRIGEGARPGAAPRQTV